MGSNIPSTKFEIESELTTPSKVVASAANVCPSESTKETDVSERINPFSVISCHCVTPISNSLFGRFHSNELQLSWLIADQVLPDISAVRS